MYLCFLLFSIDILQFLAYLILVYLSVPLTPTSSPRTVSSMEAEAWLYHSHVLRPQHCIQYMLEAQKVFVQ